MPTRWRWSRPRRSSTGVTGVGKLEVALLRHVDLPWGTSIIAIAEKLSASPIQFQERREIIRRVTAAHAHPLQIEDAIGGVGRPLLGAQPPPVVR